MPLFDFQCRDCDHESEYLVRFADEVPACPKCDGGRMIRLLSVPVAHTGTHPDPPPTGPCGSACGCFPGG